MAYQLPDGTIVKTPRKGRSFLLDGIRHPEMNLVRWDVMGRLDYYGITEVATPEPPAQSVFELKNQAQRVCKDALQEYLLDNFDTFWRTLIVQAYARGDATVRGRINEVWDWERNIISEFFDLRAAIDATHSKAELKAVVWDFSLWSASKPPHNIKTLIS